MTVTQSIIRAAKQVQWHRAHKKKVNNYRKKHHKQPWFIVEKNPHEFTYEEILKMKREHHTACEIVKSLLYYEK